MKKIHYNLLLLFFGLAFLFLYACSSSDSAPTPPSTTTLTGITVARTTGAGTVTVNAGATLNLSNTFTVKPLPATATLGTLTWTVAPKSGSSATATISSTTLTAGTTAGAMTLTVTAGTGSAAKSATIDITITEALTLETLALTRKTDQTTTTATVGVALDLTTVFDVGVTPTGTDATVTWSVSVPDGSNATGTIAQGTSMLTATATGELTVTITSTADNTKTATAPITVVPPTTLTALSLTRKTDQTETKATVGVALDLTTVFDVGVTPTGADASVTWSLSVPDGSNAAGTIAQSTSMLTATAIGELTITITSTIDTTKTDTAPITVTQALTAISLVRKTEQTATTATVGVALDLTTVFDVTVVPTEANASVTWSLSIPPGSTATGTIAQGTSMLTATATGELTITITSTADTTKTNTAPITVVLPSLTALSLTRKTDQRATTAMVDVALDLTTVFDVGVTPTGADASVIWSVSTPTGSTASGTIPDNTTNLVATAIGDLTITITSSADTTKTDTATIAVVASTGTEVSVTIASTTAVKGTDLTLSAAVANNDDKTVTWTLVSTTPPNDSTVTITDGKLISTAATTATVATVKATSVADTSKSVMQDITITSPVTTFNINSIEPATKGVDYTLAANVSVVTGADETVTWTLVSTTPPDDSTVTITDGKLITTIATTATAAKIMARSNADNAKTATVDITLNPPLLTTLSIVRKTSSGTGTLTVPAGGTLDLAETFMVTPRPDAALVGTLTWFAPAATDTTAGGTIANNNMFTAGSTTGTVTLTVSSNATAPPKTATIDITIGKALPTSFTINRKAEQADTRAFVNEAIDVTTIFDVVVAPANADASLEWSIESGNAAGTITPAGLYTAANEGTVVLKVTSTVATTITQVTDELTVSPRLRITVTISGGTIVRATAPLTLSAEVTGDIQNSNTDVVWTIEPSVAGADISTVGVVSVTQDVTPGTALTVVATHTASGQPFKGDLTVSVQGAVVVAVTGVTVTSTGPVTIGTDYNLMATVAPTNAAQTVTWTITAPATVPPDVTIENGILKTVAGTTPTGTISITATSTADGTTTGMKVTATAVELTLNHALSLERKTDQGETKSYVSGDPIDLNTVFEVTPVGETLRWAVTPIATATVVTTTGMLTAKAAGIVQVSVTSSDGTKSSNKMPYTINAAVVNPVTSIELLTTDPVNKQRTIIMRVRVTRETGDPIESDGYNEPSDADPWDISLDSKCATITIRNLQTYTCDENDKAIILNVFTRGSFTDKNGKYLSKEYTIPLLPSVTITSVATATIGTPLTLAASVDGVATTTSVAYTIKGTAPNGVNIENGRLVTLAGTAQPGTVTVVATYTIPDTTPVLTSIDEQEITLSPPALESLSITRTMGAAGTVRVFVGETLDLDATFTVTPAPTGAEVGALTWTVPAADGTTVGGTIDASNIFTAGDITGTARLTVSSGSSASAITTFIDITIEAPPAPVTGVTVTSTGSVTIGTDYTLMATVEPAGAAQTVTWSITAPTPVPSGVSIENGILKTVAGTTPAVNISVTATSTTNNAAGMKVRATDVELMLTHALSLERKTDQGETQSYVSGDPIDLNTVFSITPVGETLRWAVTPTTTATVDTATGLLTAVAAGEVQVSVTSSDGTKSSNRMLYTINAAVVNPVTSIELISSIYRNSHNVLRVRITRETGDPTVSTVTITPPLVPHPWNFRLDSGGCQPVDQFISAGVIITYSCQETYTGPIEFTVFTIGSYTDKNGKHLSKQYSKTILPLPTVIITSAATATIGTPLTLAASVDGTPTTTGVAYTIKGTAPNGVTIETGRLVTEAGTAQPGTVTVVATYTIPDTISDNTSPITVTKEQEITLSN